MRQLLRRLFRRRHSRRPLRLGCEQLEDRVLLATFTVTNISNSGIGSLRQAILDANAQWLKSNADQLVLIEGHCDERGTNEYNLALGERRALSVRTYLVSLGLAPDRLRTVSYGKEFPFDPGRTEEAMAKNRRGHFVITSN